MPKIPTTHELVVSAQRHEADGSLKLLGIDQPKGGEEIRKGDKVMVLIREFYVRDNHEGSRFWGDDSPAEITVSFGIETGGQKYDISLGTFSGIMDKTSIKLQDLIVLPVTEIADYFVLTVNAIEENDLKKAIENVGKTITFVENVLQVVPGGNTVSPVVNLTGQLLNLIAALSPDDVLMRESATYLVDSTKLGHVKGVKFLKTGLLYIYEEGFTFDQEKNVFKDSDDRVADPTRILLEIVKPKP